MEAPEPNAAINSGLVDPATRSGWWREAILVLTPLLLAAAYPFLQGAVYQGSPSLHAAIEMVGALIGLLAGVSFVVRFYSLGNRFHLLVGLAFFVNGAEDLVHGFLEFGRLHGWIDYPAAVFRHSIPATYFSGRMLMAVLLLLAPFFSSWMKTPRSPKRETFLVSTLVLTLTVIATAVAFVSPLPDLAVPVFGWDLVARPLDFVSAVVFAAALVVFFREYRRTRDRLTWWLTLAIGVNVTGQLMMSFSRGFYDPFFDVAHVYKVLGYALPLLGFSLYQISSILELRRAEQTVSQETERLAVTLRSIGDGVIATDVLGRVHLINGVAEKLTGWSHAEAAGRPLDQVFHIIDEKSGQRCENPVAKVLQSGKVVGLANHTALIARDGAQRSIADSGAPIRDAQGNVIGVVLVFRDVTEQNRAAVELQLNEARLEMLVQLDQMTDATLKELTDFTLEAAVSLTRSKIGYLAFLNEDESVLTMHSWSKTAMAECAIIDKPIVYPVVDTGLWGEAVRQRKPIVTNDYQAPNPLKKGYPDGHVELLRHMNTPIFDGDRMVIVAGVGNKETPYDESDVRQLTLLMRGMWQLIQRRERQEAIKKSHDELEVRVRERTAALAVANQTLQENAEALRSAMHAAEAASQAKSTFLANMSHEIRTPLNAVIGMTELVLKSQLSAQQREFLQTVRDSGEALLSVINDILDFSKIEAGKLVLDCTTFDLRESLGDTMKSFALRAHQQGLELTCFIHADVPHRVVGDYSRLRQIVVNLVGNAIKFTEKGEVSLEVFRESHTEKHVVLHLVVSDTGIGVPLEKQSSIFEMFEQADATTTRRHGGTGLGLAIASRLVALMDGRIWVESEVGRGSRFHFAVQLALSAGEPEEPLAPEPACLHNMRVLVVDDNATNRRILDEVLRSWHMRPTSAPSAAEAIRLILEARQKGEPYRLILTDAHMPKVDGFMLAEQLKKEPSISNTVIMMLTSGDRPDDMQHCRELGIQAYLLKPVKQSELLEAIELSLGVTVPRDELLAGAKPREVRPLDILLAEDSLVNQKLAVALLRGRGHRVTVANNGREAVSAVQEKDYNVVLMDVQMPEMDGFEATKIIRSLERPKEKHVPIIAMTAHALKGDRDRCLAAGMDGYIAKPIRPEELFGAIETLFASSKEPADPAVPGVPAGGVINWVEAVHAVQGNLDLLRSVVEAEVAEIPRLMEAMRQAVAACDAKALKLPAHTLKGSLRYFGKTAAYEEVLRLEKMAIGGDLAESAIVLAALEPDVERVVAEFQEYLQKNA